MNSVFKKGQTNYLERRSFLDGSVSVARYDELTYPLADKLTEKQNSFFWRETEIDLSRDRSDFQKLSEAEQHVFTANLKYQILLDSVQGRAPSLCYLPFASLPEVETWIQTWAFYETIHSRSYTHIIRNIYVNPSEVFDSITEVDEIVKRAVSVTEEYDAILQDGLSREQLMDALFKSFVATNVLEGVRFYISFACGFSFAERKLMEGNAKILTLIARDESLHLAFTQDIIKRMLQGEEGSEWQKVAINNIDHIYKVFDDVIKQEKEWARYLLSQGSVLGLSEESLCGYIDYIASVRLKALGLNSEKLSNPFPWVVSYLVSENVQSAPQETDNTQYLTGALDMKLPNDAFAEYEL